MTARQRSQRLESQSGLVECIEGFVAADPNAPTGTWVVREGTVWREDHPAVVGWRDFFVVLGDAQVTPKYFPPRSDE